MKRLPNLLSKEQKKVYRRYLLVIYLRRFLYLQIVATLVVVSFFGVHYWFNQDKLNDLSSVLNNFSQLQTQIKIEELQANANEHNNRLKTASAILSARSDLSFYLHELAKLIPSGITLDSVEIGTENSTIDVEGRAAARDLVVELQNRMEQSQYFTVTYAPLSNLTEAVNTPFRFILSLKQVKK